MYPKIFNGKLGYTGVYLKIVDEDGSIVYLAPDTVKNLREFFERERYEKKDEWMPIEFPRAEAK